MSTPTGSTAYSMSAGGSIVQTNTDSICLTPLAPHSLSFRPLILPASSRIRVQKKVDGRGCAWVSLDGATRFKLDQGESIIVTGSEKDMRFVTQQQDDLTDLWVQRLKNMFNWNIRDSMKQIKKNSVAYTSN